MKYCSDCNVKIRNDIQKCPLCDSSKLDIIDNFFVVDYPKISPVGYFFIYKRILLFLLIVSSGVCLIINYIVSNTISWSLIVIFGSLYIWGSLDNSIKKMKNFGDIVMYQTFLLSCLVFVIDFATDFNRWSINYVLPFIFVVAILMINFALIIRPSIVIYNIVYLLLASILGISPIFMIIFGKVTIVWPSIVSVICSIFTIIGMFIFINKQTRSEIKKRFHI